MDGDKSTNEGISDPVQTEKKVIYIVYENELKVRENSFFQLYEFQVVSL